MKEIGISKAAKETGVTYQTVKSWVETADTGAESPIGPSYEDLLKENRKLKRELGYSKKINEILKKSTAILSKDIMEGTEWSKLVRMKVSPYRIFASFLELFFGEFQIMLLLRK